MSSQDIQQHIDSISNLLGCIGWNNEFIPAIAQRVVDQVNRLLAVNRNQELDDRLRGSIENCNWVLEIMSARLKELRADHAHALEEEASVHQEANPIDVDALPKPY